MLDAIKSLIDSGLINEDVSTELNEAWDKKLTEAREEVRAELREEFAQRYEHDKSVMVEALDRMVSEGLTKEIEAVAEEKKQLAEDRVKFQTKMLEGAGKFNNFMTNKLAEEITELRKDRAIQSEGFSKLEKFVMEALAKEISEFAQDKRDLVESKVRLVAEAKEKLENLKESFVAENAAKVKGVVAKHLSNELSALHEDIKVARENNFGRRIFEAYAAEFGSTLLNENAEIKRLHADIEAKDKKLAEAVEVTTKAKALVESKNTELKMIKEANARTEIMDELLTPLNESKAEVMRSLLENVQTNRLQSVFDKYLPAVLANKEVTAEAPAKKTVISESKEVTGNKKSVTTAKVDNDDNSNIIAMKKLAGL
jgi:hypothetical protein